LEFRDMPRHYNDRHYNDKAPDDNAPDDHPRDQTADLPPTAWTGPRHAASDETRDAIAEAVGDDTGFGIAFGTGLGTGFGTGLGSAPFDTTADDADSTFVDTTTDQVDSTTDQADSTFDTTPNHGASIRRRITVPHHGASTGITSPRTVRVIAYVASLALLIGGGAAFTFRGSSSARQAAASRTDDRASRDLARATASLTPTPTTTVEIALYPEATPTAAPTTPPAPAVTTTPAPAATRAPAATKPTLKTTTVAAAGCSSYTGNRLIACKLLPSFGFATSQMSSLDPMWARESGWNAQAQNPSSGAYGIPQALPGSKMATAGSDWSTNPATQIKWGLDYIKQRYGSPAAAWSFWQANGWY
jgi:hypothetical protein